MEKKFLQWINDNRKKIEDLNIRIDEIVNSETEHSLPSTRLDLFTDSRFLRITAFQSRRIYAQILEIETSESVYFIDDYLEESVNLEDFLWDKIYKLL